MCIERTPASDPTVVLVSRRRFCAHVAFAVGLPHARGAFPASAIAAPTQNNWRRCQKCNGLFFNGYADKGRCPAGGGHAVFGRGDYLVVYDDSTGPGQGDWRFCTKCKTLFFNGYPAKGVCAADRGGHTAAGYNFFLAHDRRPTGREDAYWRFCNKCMGLFYNNAPGSSVCPQGGRHVAQGYQFVLTIAGVNID
jgi:hypothetical protein